jgi:thiol:disulfide interchange protein
MITLFQRPWLPGLLLAVLVGLFGGHAAEGSNAAAAKPVRGPVRALHLSVDLLPLRDSIQPGGSADVGLHFLLDPGWHVYWVNAGDSGEPPKIKWTLPPGITADAMQFPAPERLPLGPLMDFGYQNEVLFPMAFHAANTLHAPSSLQLSAHVDWLVCREVCIPGKADLALPLTLAEGAGTAVPGAQAIFDRFRARLPQPLPSSSHAVFASTPKELTLAVQGQPSTSAQFFPLEQNQIDNPAPQIVRSVPGGIEIALQKDPNLQSIPQRLSGVLVLADGKAYEVHAAPGALPPAVAVAGSTASGGFLNVLRIAGLAFLGGIILNLMPCVFPVLFIKGLSLFESSSAERAQMRVHGLAYTLGILVSFWAVVAVLLGLRAGGHHLGWGFQFQSPVFLAVIALLLFFLGLSLAGMFEIGLSLTSKGGGLAAKQGYTGSFFTGVLATIVATPCVAPFMGVAIGFALVQSTWIAFIIFTTLALGLAAPYVLLTLQPAWTKLLPRPGAWMEVLKQATSVPIFVTVIWMVWLFAQSAGLNALFGLLGAFLLLAIAGWILGRWPAQRVPSIYAVIVIALAVTAPIYAMHIFPAPETDSARRGNADAASKENWEPFNQAAIDNYRAQGKPVFVDFTASWCLSCQVNERVVLDREDVRQRLRDSGVVLIRADWTHHDDDIAQALNRLGRSGVPTYVLYPPKQDPRILPEVLTPGVVFGALDELGTRSKQEQVAVQPNLR